MAQAAQAVLICLALLPFASACTVGSRGDCDGNGVCVSDSFFDNDPFFNKCECDFCWSGAGSCDQNFCIFLMIPVVILLCVCCVFCICCCCIGGTLRTVWKAQQQQAVPPVVGPASGVDPTTAPPVVMVQATVVEPATPVVVGATATNENYAA
ncbi:unnamed protein product [Symbiodinium natans]|uniref:Uncharacterized protein n=1 Tax=Symbiodinium natans TaxID=878477 RepID=A0A812NBC9_9DINO|nr:unnamed protein product [Symbiodinium natans]